MKKFLSLLLALTAAVYAGAAEKCDIGGKFSGFASPVWLDGNTRTVKDVREKKDFTVIYLWMPDQAALSDFPVIMSVAKKFNDKVAFAGIALGTPERIKRFPGAGQLNFPQNIDSKRAVVNQIELPTKLPVSLVLDKNNTLLWSGATASLPMILNECLSGKFDLNDEIRKNKFSRAVNSAIQAKEFEKAYNLLNAEWQKSCDSMELLNAQIAILTKKLNRHDDAFALAHTAQQKNPGNHRFFEVEYKLLANPAFAQRLPDFFARVKKEFVAKPGVLMAFAIAEMGRPPADLDMKLVLSLVELGWNSGHFPKDIERGMYAIEYAKIAHAAGRTDIALQLTVVAVECLKNDPRHHAGAKQAETYYRKLLEIAPLFKPVDLKK